MRKLALLGVLVLGVAALVQSHEAHAQATSSRGIELGSRGSRAVPTYVNGPLNIDARGSANCDGGVGLCFTGKGKLVYDFPSVPATGAGSGCQDSAAGTASGCRFGDTVMLGIDQVPPANLNAAPPVAYISAADSFKVRVCNDSSDAGAIDWPDASYTVRCFR